MCGISKKGGGVEINVAGSMITVKDRVEGKATRALNRRENPGGGGKDEVDTVVGRGGWNAV